jgi:D-glycero-alpha-D-manno-heptose-7-phosphate kinase
MIISTAPVRITLGGGGTDLPSYYSEYGGFLIAAAINKYIFVFANEGFHGGIRLSYSQIEAVNHINDLNHNISREALRFLGIEGGIELTSMSDVPPNCGLGTSSSFTVALLNALHSYRGDVVSQKQLAEEACRIEIDILKAPVGKQDQYISAFGGVTCLTFEKNGDVMVEPLRIPDGALAQLESHLLLFYTGIERSASKILLEQDEKTKKHDSKVTENLHTIKEIGLETRTALEKGNVDQLGELLHTHWEIKRKRSEKMTEPFIDECYEAARQSGALGGKIIGAGGGGFLMFYCPDSNKAKLSQAMVKMGLKPMQFRFAWAGAKTLPIRQQNERHHE